jgi:hypothetical protein
MVFTVALFCALSGAGRGGDDGRPGDRAPDRAAYESAAAQADKSADAQVRLALWCEAHGLSSERMKHLALAVASDPNNALARGLMGLVGYQSEWKKPDQLARELDDDPARTERIQEYLKRRAEVRERADDLWKLAVWCEQNGLTQQATAHFFQVLKHDPSRDAAWKHLGFKKLGGHWDKPERVAAAKAAADLQHKANKHWKPLLEKWRGALSSRDHTRRDDALKGLAAVADPRAVPSIWIVFVLGGQESQKTAVKLLGQIDAPGSSRALALLALMSQSAEVKREALQFLQKRDPRDYAAVLIALLRDPIKYDAKAVDGPGSRGELLVKSNSGNVKRLYTPLVAPSLPMLPNDSVALDDNGLPVVIREVGVYTTPRSPVNATTMNQAAAMLGWGGPAETNRLAALLGRAGLPSAISQKIAGSVADRPSLASLGIPLDMMMVSATMNRQIDIPIGQMMLDAQMSAQVAAQQLAGDIQAIDAYNAPILDTNQKVQTVLSSATGADLGADRTSWEKWLVDLSGYAYSAPRSYDEQPTIVEQVPLSYQPQAAPVIVDQPVMINVSRHSCFGAGTPVRTIGGLREIETLQAGDQVLTADLKTGALKYQPLLVVYHNPPNATFRVELDGGDSIVATGIHRLWKAGKGWTMTRDLKPGDSLRTLGGLGVVKTVEKERVQPVFNLHVAEGESFFVGRTGVLAHDNSVVNPTPNPFDSVPDLDRPATTMASPPPQAATHE